MPGLMRITRLLSAMLISALALLAFAVPVGAGVAHGWATSTLWAGYAARQPSGAAFQQVSASWRIPSARCSSTERHYTYAYVWVALQGAWYLAQDGTGTVCPPALSSGRSAAPYAFVFWADYPGTSAVAIAEPASPGDLMNVVTSVHGRNVTFTIADTTRHWSAVKRIRVPPVYPTSAEWIVEHPPTCDTPGCSEAPLPDFTTVTITGARAVTLGGRQGSISSFDAVRYALLSDNMRTLLAWPSVLTADGTSFTVTRTNRRPPRE